MYIAIAIIGLGFLIFIHEFGHFIAAKIMGVQVNEFALGMGPTLLKKQGKETLYSLKLLPIGGFCAMEGENEDTDNERSFLKKKPWQRLIILCAGSLMNYLSGFLIVLIMFACVTTAYSTNEIGSFEETCPYNFEEGLQIGDKIVSINGERIYTASDFSLILERDDDCYVDIVIVRDGHRIHLDNFNLEKLEYDVNGEKVEKYGIGFVYVNKNVFTCIKYSWYSVLDFVRNVRLGLSDLIFNFSNVKEVSGVVGMVSTINEIGNSSGSVFMGILNAVYIIAFISVNLAVMNMLPIPALDGGRVFFLIVSTLFKLIFKKDVNTKVEMYINGIGLLILLILMVVIMFNDIVKLFV